MRRRKIRPADYVEDLFTLTPTGEVILGPWYEEDGPPWYEEDLDDEPATA
ncbi:MAG: hypothetical protein M3454_10365 [Actinomycetota bacterium]|nr:hypothetical protein [Actinomycetota bacterium]